MVPMNARVAPLVRVAAERDARVVLEVVRLELDLAAQERHRLSSVGDTLVVPPSSSLYWQDPRGVPPSSNRPDQLGAASVELL